MTRIFLSGIGGVERRDIVKRTQELGELYKPDTKIHSLSLGDSFRSVAAPFVGIEDRLIDLPDTIQRAMRSGITDKVAIKLAKYSSGDHVVVEGPLTIVDNSGQLHNTFFNADFDVFSEPHINRQMDRFVSIVDDPTAMLKRKEGNAYPVRDTVHLLQWMGAEANRMSDVAYTHLGKVRSGRNIGLVWSRGYSDTFLLKLLEDGEDTPLVYFAYPMTHLKQDASLPKDVNDSRARNKEMVNSFREELEKYCAYVNPIELADLRTTTEADRRYTAHRDLYYFVRQSPMVVAYFPADVHSTGVDAELKEATSLTKTTVLIHPAELDSKSKHHPFSMTPTYHFRTADDFFAAVNDSKTNPRYRELSVLLSRDGEPRYEKMIETIGPALKNRI